MPRARRRCRATRAIARERDRAFARFERSGLPHRRVEQWKYTDLRALMREAKPLAPPPDAAAKEHAQGARANILSGMPAHRFVFVDGAFVPELSEQAAIPGVRVYSLASELARGDGAGALTVARERRRARIPRWRSTMHSRPTAR